MPLDPVRNYQLAATDRTIKMLLVRKSFCSKFFPRGEVYSKKQFKIFFATKRLYKGRLLNEISASKELSNPMKSSSKVVRNSRSSDCRHLGGLLEAL